MRVALICGTRPNIIKCSALVPAMRAAGVQVTVIHTGQHADEKMSAQLMLELGVAPDVHLARPEGATAAERFASMLLNLTRYFANGDFDFVVVVGDCDSTLAGALAAKKCGLRVAHVEAGLRANDAVQENINRKAVDAISDIFFCSEQGAIDNLSNEGFECSRSIVYLTT